MKSILVATDLSNRSDRAVQRAFRVAEQSGAELTVVNIVDSALPERIAQEVASSSKDKLQSFCASISAKPVTVRVEIGDPLVSIHAVADEVDADLIVVGVHRERAIADFFLGTTVERLARASLRPILLVTGAVDHDYERPVCGIDMSPACLAAVEAASRIAPNGRISTFHAVHVPFRGFLAPSESAAAHGPFVDAARHELEGWLKGVTFPQNCEPPKIEVGGVAEALYRTVTDKKGDLIVIGAHGRSSLSPSYLGSLAEDLIRRPPRDLLIVRR